MIVSWIFSTSLLTLYFYLCLFFWSENVWDFTKVEDVVDILQEQLILQLVVIEEEHPAGDVRAELLQNPLQVIPPVFETMRVCINLTISQSV